MSPWGFNLSSPRKLDVRTAPLIIFYAAHSTSHCTYPIIMILVSFSKMDIDNNKAHHYETSLRERNGDEFVDNLKTARESYCTAGISIWQAMAILKTKVMFKWITKCPDNKEKQKDANCWQENVVTSRWPHEFKKKNE